MPVRVKLLTAMMPTGDLVQSAVVDAIPHPRTLSASPAGNIEQTDDPVQIALWLKDKPKNGCGFRRDPTFPVRHPSPRATELNADKVFEQSRPPHPGSQSAASLHSNDPPHQECGTCGTRGSSCLPRSMSERDPGRFATGTALSRLSADLHDLDEVGPMLRICHKSRIKRMRSLAVRPVSSPDILSGSNGRPSARCAYRTVKGYQGAWEQSGRPIVGSRVATQPSLCA